MSTILVIDDNPAVATALDVLGLCVARAAANGVPDLALLSPGDTILGMSLAHGGHLTHGATVNFSGKIYKSVAYGLEADTEVFGTAGSARVWTMPPPSWSNSAVAWISTSIWRPSFARNTVSIVFRPMTISRSR